MAGYNLTSIVLDFANAPRSNALTVTVREDSSGDPSGTVLYTLTNPTIAAGLNEFSAPSGATLNFGRTYWVVASYSSISLTPSWRYALLSNGVDTGAAAGWTMDARAKESLIGGVWAVVGGTGPAAIPVALQIAVKGTLQPVQDLPGTAALSTTQPDLGIHVTATLTDVNTPISGTTWQWSSSDTADGTFADISGATSATYVPTEADLGKFLKATVSYTDALRSGNSASVTAAKAVHAITRTILDTFDHSPQTGNLGEPGITTRFRTGEHPGGYKPSDIRVRLSGSYSSSTFSVHIYSAASNGTPNRSLFVMPSRGSVSSVSRATFFDAPRGSRLAPNTDYHVAMVSTSGTVTCQTAFQDPKYAEESASDWSTGIAYNLNNQGRPDGRFSIKAAPCGSAARRRLTPRTSRAWR